MAERLPRTTFALTATSEAAMPTPVSDYSALQRGLHWTMAGAMIALIGLGLWIPTVDAETNRTFKDLLYAIHKSVGAIVLGLALWRIAVKLIRPVAPVPGLTPFEAVASKTAHLLLYALMVAMPLAGWMSSSALGFPVWIFGVIPLPDLVPVNTDLGFALLRAHQNMAWLLIAVLVAHVGAAGFHHVVRRDRVLLRMLGR
jgi:cytochrome b561